MFQQRAELRPTRRVINGCVLAFGVGCTVRPAAAASLNFKSYGSLTAPLVMEVFVDYQCPACKTMYLTTIPQIIAQYVVTGKVKLVHRDCPLPSHKWARLAAEYANAAGDIGRYDVAVEQIFVSQAEWTITGDVDSSLSKVMLASEMVRIRDLIKNDGNVEQSITDDVKEAKLNRIVGSPALIITYKKARQMIRGAVPFSILKSFIDHILLEG